MATVGEVQYCGRETRGQIVTLRYFNGRPVVSLGGGHNKIFVVEEKGAVSALHPLENELDAFGEEQELSIEKQNLENLGELKMIRCGRGHTLYLTQDGFVFASGKGAFGVLGLGGALNSPTPVTVKTLSDKTVVMVACGSEHSLALTDMGDVYSWGRGFEGQLGISKLTTVSSTPKYLKALRDRPVTKIACGQSHSLVLTKAGELFAWGEGRCGQLGCGVQRACFVPQQVVFTAPHQITIVDIAGGSGHSGAVTASGDLYMWGLNNYGQLGVGDQKPRFYPTPVLQDVVGVYLHDIKQLSCSDYSSFVIDTQGRLYSWGKGFIGHNDETLELLPRKVELNTEHRRFSQLYAAGSVFACFAPLHVYSISPYCGPVTGGTKLSLIGTAFAQSEELRVRFRYEGNVVERPCEFDQETSSLVCFTPSFQDEGEDLTLPCACELEVTMDGEHYVPCDEKFLVYAKDLQPTALNPKCAAVNGSTVLQIDIDLEAFQQAWLWHLTVGFAVKPKAKAFASPAAKREANHTPSHDESRMSQASARGGESSSATDVEWHLTAGKYEKGHVTCKVPVITNYDENSMAYMVDIAPNGQQFTGKPLNFRYYDVTVSSVAPLSGSINAGTTVVISGRGLYDSSAKKLHLSSESGGRREVVLEWDRKNKTYIGLIPPLSWLFKGSEPDSYTLKQFAKEDISMQLTLNGMNFIPLPSFHYIDITITRFSKAKLDPALPPDKAQQVWLAEEPLVQGEPPEVKQKREADEATEMNVSVRPGGKIYIWVEDLVKAEGLTARFMVEGKTADVMAVYKNSQKAGAVVPDLGDFQTPVEVRVELSMNGQSFSETGKVLKYLGATAPEEGGKRRGK